MLPKGYSSVFESINKFQLQFKTPYIAFAKGIEAANFVNAQTTALKALSKIDFNYLKPNIPIINLLGNTFANSLNYNSEVINALSAIAKTSSFVESLNAINNFQNFYKNSFDTSESFSAIFATHSNFVKAISKLNENFVSPYNLQQALKGVNVNFAVSVAEIAENEGWDEAEKLRETFELLNSILTATYSSADEFFKTCNRAIKKIIGFQTIKPLLMCFIVYLIKDILFPKIVEDLVFSEKLQKVETNIVNNIIIAPEPSNIIFTIQKAEKLNTCQELHLQNTPSSKSKKKLLLMEGQEVIVLQKNRKWIFVAVVIAPMEYETGWVPITSCE